MGSVAEAGRELTSGDSPVVLDTAGLCGDDAGVEEFVPAPVYSIQEGAAW